MTIQAGVGYSTHRNPKEAVAKAVAEAREQGGFIEPDLVLMFGTTGYKQNALVAAARAETNNAPLAGCSAEGVISAARSEESGYAVTIALLKSDTVRFDLARAEGLKTDSKAAGAHLGQTLAARRQYDALGLMLLPDGLTMNFDSLAQGLGDKLGDGFLPTFGGTSADNWALQQTYQYFDDEVTSDSVVAVLISGAAKLAWSVNHGCASLGSERKVTKAEQNTIFEIDNKPALDVLKEYLDLGEMEDWQKATANLTIGFKAPGAMRGYDEYVVRYVIGRDEEHGSFAISTNVDAGASVWMMRRDYDKISAGLERIGREIRDQLKGAQPRIVFHFDCAGRGKVILRDEEKQALLLKLRTTIGPDAPWIGFHSYGEIGPFGKQNWFHNYTAVVAALG